MANVHRFEDHVNGTRVPRAGRPAVPAPCGERRGAPRVLSSMLPAFTAKVVDGADVEIVNVSKSGALARSEARMMPGAMIGLRFLTSEAAFIVFGRVVRSSLLSIEGGKPLYESALAFSQVFPMLAEDPQAAMATAPESQPVPVQAHDGYPAEIGRLGGQPTVLTVTAFADDRPERVLQAFERSDL
jgi:hypothetical protein